MSRIDGPDHRVITHRGQDYHARMMAAVRDTLRAVTHGWHGVVTVDDLGAILREWTRRVDADAGLLNDVGQAYVDAARMTRVAQRDALVMLLRANGSLVAAAAGDGEFEIPLVTNQAAVDKMSIARNRLVNVGNDVWEDARSELLDGLQEGEGIAALQSRVMGVTDFIESRAAMIARSEIANVMNQGALDQMRQIDAPGMTKEWIATLDNRTRPEHADMNGDKVGINDTFAIGEDPGDAPNCRCTLGFDLPDEQLVDSACDCGSDELALLASGALTAAIDLGDGLTSVCSCDSGYTSLSNTDRQTAVIGDDVLLQMKHFGEVPAKLNNVLADYQNGADNHGSAWYKTYNRWLRAKSGDLEAIRAGAPKPVAANIELLDKAISSSKLKENVQVYKGVANGASAFGDAWKAEGDMTGTTWTNYAYSSTSADRNVAINFTGSKWDPYFSKVGEETPTVLNIVVPKGEFAFSLTDPTLRATSIINIQKEVLLPRGTTYRVVADRGIVDGVRSLDVELVIPGSVTTDFAVDVEYQQTLQQALAKIANAPIPSEAAVKKAQIELENARAGTGRAGGEARGGSAADRRKQRQNLFKEFGGDEKGYIVCHGCGVKMHWDDPGSAANPHGYARFERGKIFVKCQGGGYQLQNLLPECFACNRSRNDKMIRNENACA